MEVKVKTKMKVKMVFRSVTAAVAFLTAGAAGAATSGPLFSDDFTSKKSDWKTTVIHGRGMKIEFGARGRNFTGLIVSSSQEKLDPVNPDATDTCWGILSPSIRLPEKRKKFLLVTFDVSADEDLPPMTLGQRRFNGVLWYDDAGNVVGHSTLRFRVKGGDFRTVRVTAPVPPDAKAFSVALGFGRPDLRVGVSVAYKNFRVYMTDSEVPSLARLDRGDFRPPKVRMVSPSPTTDRTMRPAFRVTDETGVDWKMLKVEIDRKDVTDRFSRTGDVVSWTGEANWSDGYHPVHVTIADTQGISYRHRRCFLIGSTPKVPKITLRDDGVTLVDGKPFFPIGIFSVRRVQAINGNSYEKAMLDLKAAGFNTIHSYGEAREPELVAMAKKHGMWMWTNEELPKRAFIEEERHWPHVIAWYTGDDTSGHQKPWENDDYDEINRALDPNRITCQADGVRSDAEYSAYHDYVTTTDVFMPEIYPLVRNTREESDVCVARVIRDMKRIADDIREAKDTRHHGIWPIIQAFDGSGWKGYPTRDELFAMTYAAICHGATGMTWYEYSCRSGMKNDPAKFPADFAVRWGNLSALSKQLSELAPVLVERRTAADRVTVSVLKGVRQDVFGFPSISTRMHRKDGFAYLIAVNSAPQAVEVSFETQAKGSVEVLYEGRTVPSRNGRFADAFKPHGVHIYRIGIAAPAK